MSILMAANCFYAVLRGTKYAGLLDEMVEIEVDSTHAYQDVLRKLGRHSPGH